MNFVDSSNTDTSNTKNVSIKDKLISGCTVLVNQRDLELCKDKSRQSCRVQHYEADPTCNSQTSISAPISCGAGLGVEPRGSAQDMAPGYPCLLHSGALVGGSVAPCYYTNSYVDQESGVAIDTYSCVNGPGYMTHCIESSPSNCHRTH